MFRMLLKFGSNLEPIGDWRSRLGVTYTFWLVCVYTPKDSYIG